MVKNTFQPQREDIAVFSVIGMESRESEQKGKKEKKGIRYLASIPYMDMERVSSLGFIPRSRTFRITFERERIMKTLGNLLQQLLRARSDMSDQEKIYKSFKKIGSSIYNNMGLQGFFRFIFDYCQNHAIFLVTDDYVIPWEWAYSEDHDKFFCELNYGIIIAHDLREVIDLIQHDRDIGREQIKDVDRNEYLKKKEALLFFDDGRKVKLYGDVDNYLPWVEIEANEMKAVIGNCMRLHSPNWEARLTAESFSDCLTRHHSNCKLVHYSGHVVDAALRFGTDDVVKPDWITGKPIYFRSHPLVFVNGCSSGTPEENSWGEIDSLAMAFIRKGASGCVVTTMPISNALAKEFATTFYKLFVPKDITIGRALMQTRQKMKKKFGTKDITWLFYTLFGSPTERLIPQDLRVRMALGLQQASVKESEDKLLRALEAIRRGPREKAKKPKQKGT